MGSVDRLAPDVVHMLKRQHRQIRLGFAAALLPGPGRQRRFDHLRELLAVHEAAEEAHVHPVAKKVTGEAGKLIKARIAEERAAKKLLRDLQKAGAGERGYSAKLIKLAKAVNSHAWHEERQEFPLLRKGVTVARRRMLGAESKITQAVAPTRPHPRVNSQLLNKLATPAVGPLDRGLDKVQALVRRVR
jgi:hemerythrin superfamily protein